MKKKFVALLATAMIILAPITTFAAEDTAEKVAALEEKVAALEQRLSDLETFISSLTGSKLVPPEDAFTENEAPADTTLDSPSFAPPERISSEFKGLMFTYDGFELTTNYSGEPCVILYGYFQNDSDAPEAAWPNFTLTVYQNGRELSSSFMMDNQACSDSSTKILPGSAPIYVGSAYELQDYSELTVELSPLMDWADEHRTTFTITLQ